MVGLRHAFGEPIILHRFKELSRNQLGQTMKVFHPDVVVNNVAVAPYQVSENASGLSERVESRVVIYVDPEIQISSSDEVTVRGNRLTVDGDASGDWVNPFTGWSPGAAVTLKRVTG